MKLLLIDGNSVLFRGFYATCYGNIMKTSKGVYTNAVYAFANMMNKAIKMIEPDYLVVAFDKGKHTFRHDLAADYKAGRKETPEELKGQFALVREMLDAYHIPFLEYDDIEADDIIGSLAKKFNKIETCVLSSDRDMLQLIDKTTSIYMMKKGMSDIAKMDEKALMDEWTLKPYQIIDYKGLAGDSSDNIKGVEGVGDKTAIKLLNEYDTCEGIYEHIDEIKGKLQEKLIKDRDSCFLSKTLATIKTDCDIPLSLDDFKVDIDEQGRNDFFDKYEMYSLIREVNYANKNEVHSSNIVKKISKELLNESFIYFVSNEFSYYERELLGACFANSEKQEYIYLADLKKDNDALKFLASDKKKVVFDLKAILHACDYNNIKIGKNTDDLFLMAFLANNYNSDLSSILINYGYGKPVDTKEIFGTEKKPITNNDKAVASYVYDIGGSLAKVYNRVKMEIVEKKMDKLYRDIELPLLYVLYDMEKTGVHCSEADLDEIATETLKKINKLEKRIYKKAGHEFNIASPKQLAEVLYDELDLPNLKKGSTNAEVLNKLVDYDPIVEDILEYRKYSKLYSTYAEGLKKYIDKDKKIHTIFSQTITNTGRLSSYDPNLQNISVRDDEGREIRRAFKPSKNSFLISCDYSQVELRVLSSLANEKKMIDAFNSGIDIHTKTAMDIFGVKQDEVDDITRRHAKAVNFGVVYGISDFGLSNQTQLSVKDAKKFIADYFKTYPNIKKYLDSQVAFCEENGYVVTMQNRRRYINEINDRNYMMREFGKRAAMNATIQGSAADLIKIAMVNVYNAIQEKGLKSKLILQVHDELIFDVPKDELEQMKELIGSTMENAYKLKCKLDYSMAIGKDWYEAK